jgi:hypothetical protein
LNYTQAKQIVLAECAKRGFKAAARLSIENGVRGVRGWRLYKSKDT